MKDINVFSCTCFCAVDPEVKKAGQTSLCTTRVGVGGLKDGDTSWFSVKVWGKGGEVFGEYVKKGSQLALTGRLVVEVYEEKVYPTIYVEDFRFMGGGKKQEKDGEATTTETTKPTEVKDNGGIADEDIPF